MRMTTWTRARGRHTRGVWLLLAALVACAPALNWREVRPESTGLVAMFPCKPSRQTREVPLAGVRVSMQLLACEAGGATWSLSHAELADPGRVGTALVALNDALAANLGSPAASPPAPLVVPGMTPQPRAQRVHLGGQRADGVAVRVDAAVFARGTHVFQAVVMQPAGERALDSEAPQNFFGGLRFSP